MKTLFNAEGTYAAAPAPVSPDTQAHAVVIGSGFGGLGAAIRLACRGYRVTVLEKLDAPGGRAYVHRQDGFVFDAGPTIITAPWFLEQLWTLCGRRIEDDVTLVPMAPFYRIRFNDGTHFDYYGDKERMRAEILRFSPGDYAGYERFSEYADLCYRLGFEELGAHRLRHAVRPVRRRADAACACAGWRTIHGVVARHIKDPKLRMVFSFHPLLIGGNPFSVTSVYSLINSLERRFGVHWAIGGTGSLVQGLVKLLESRGGSLRLNAEVRADHGRRTRRRAPPASTLASGERLAADIVVSNADSAWTYKHLVEPQHRRHWTDARIERGNYSMSLFVWYFGTNRRFDDVPHHMIMMGPRYKALLHDIFRRKHLSDDFSLYLHRPTATDPSLAPTGCDTFYVLSPVPHLDSGTDWSTMAETYRQRIAAELDRTVLPGFERHVVTSRLTTPVDFRDRLLSYKGAAFGLEPLMTQSAWFRPHNISEDIDRLFFVGASTHPGAGVPGVLMSAQALQTIVPDPHTLRQAV
ncbi:MAG: phytoene desaturase family protein [Burkholderiaceae bacterium]|nr:phytoene desaturase family protein [Burkholderiaceae bacterium]